MPKHCFVVVSDSGESWALEGDAANTRDTFSQTEANKLLPKLLADDWHVLSVTAGSGSKDGSSYWLVQVAK